MKTKLLSQPQRRILQNLMNGRTADSHVFGRSAFGGHERTMLMLKKHGLVTRGEPTKITEAGVKALETGKVVCGA